MIQCYSSQFSTAALSSSVDSGSHSVSIEMFIRFVWVWFIVIIRLIIKVGLMNMDKTRNKGQDKSRISFKVESGGTLPPVDER